MNTASATSNAPSGNGSCSATPQTTGAADAERCRIMIGEGSTPTTDMKVGS